MYFHCFINKSKEEIQKVWLFYNENNSVFNDVSVGDGKLY
jgi:hypothetical protein